MTAQRKTRPRGFADWNPRPDTLALVGQVQAVLDEYREHLPLTVRQVFYRLGRRTTCRVPGTGSRKGRPPPRHLRRENPQGHALPQQVRAGAQAVQVSWRKVNGGADARGHRAHPGGPAQAVGKGQVSFPADRKTTP